MSRQTDAHIAHVDCKYDEADALLGDAADAAPARPAIWPVVARKVEDATLADAEAFLGTVARTQTDGPCLRYLSALIADAKYHRFL